MTPKFITIHETDNPGFGANAEAHARLQENGNSRQASWHYQVDEQYAIQSIPDNEVAWHGGDGQGQGNMASIAIEICVNKDGNYKKAVQNAAELTRSLMAKWNIPLDRVVQHNHWSGKNCPSVMRSGKVVTWNDFKAMVKETKDDWVKENSIWYYFEDGVKRVGWLFTDNKWYYLKPEMATGWLEVSGTWYFFQKDGSMATGWMRSSGKWYYLDYNGKMVTGKYTIDEEAYAFNEKGALI